MGLPEKCRAVWLAVSIQTDKLLTVEAVADAAVADLCRTICCIRVVGICFRHQREADGFAAGVVGKIFISTAMAGAVFIGERVGSFAGADNVERAQAVVADLPNRQALPVEGVAVFAYAGDEIGSAVLAECVGV